MTAPGAHGDAGWQARLARGAAELGVPLDAAQCARFEQLAALLRERNRDVNLTAVDEPDEVLTVHLLDSLSIAPHLGAARRIVDVGTGAGFPGLALAIAFPERRFVLIDGTQKKIRFVQEAIERLGLANAEAQAVRAEHLRPEPRFDAVTVRAVGGLGEIAARCRHLLAPGGAVLAMKGRRPTQELDELPPGWDAEVTALRVPGLEAERHLVRLTRSPRKLR